MTTVIDAVRNSPLASELSPAEIQLLAGILTIRELKDGEVLLPEGSRDSNLHVIVVRPHRSRTDVGRARSEAAL